MERFSFIVRDVALFSSSFRDEAKTCLLMQKRANNVWFKCPKGVLNRILEFRAVFEFRTSINTIIENIAGEGVSDQEALQYFVQQYGLSEDEALALNSKDDISSRQLHTLIFRLAQDHQLQPFQIVDSNLLKGAITKNFITSWKNIAKIISDDNRLKTTKVIKFRKLNLKILPSIICQLKNLADLDIINNQVVALPNSIGELTKLQRFKAINNKLTFLPESLFQCLKITSINASKNPIKEIPASILKLKKIQIFSFTYRVGMPLVMKNVKNGKSICLHDRNGLKLEKFFNF